MKLYKVEYEDFGWKDLVGILKGYVNDIENEVNRAKKEVPESPLLESFINAASIVKNKIFRYKYDIEKQLKQQGLKLS